MNARGKRHATRYEILPLAGEQHLDPAVAAARAQDFLRDELPSGIEPPLPGFREPTELATAQPMRKCVIGLIVLIANKVRDYGRHRRVETDHIEHPAVNRVGEW